MKIAKLSFFNVLLIFIISQGAVLLQVKEASSALRLTVNVDQVGENATRLRDILSGVGSDFLGYAPQLAPALAAGPLRGLGITRLRVINVDVGNTQVKSGSLIAPKLDKELKYCEIMGVQPHIIIGHGIPPWLSTHGTDPNYGPKDWSAYQQYIQIFFKYVILDRGFRKATWEVANEPDWAGAPVPSYPRTSKKGSEEDYQAYLRLYSNIAQVAAQFEKDHPGILIPIGGPSSTAPQNYRGFKFNWRERFLRDVSRMGLKLNFFTVHYYGNHSSIGKRQSYTGYPTFEKMTVEIKRWINKYKPGLPIWVTEWGPSYIVDMNPAGIVNGNFVGAAWSAAFIHDMLKCQVERSILLSLADKRDNWGWPSLFHGATPKPLYFVYQMFHRLRGSLLEARGGSTAVGGLAARNGEQLAMIIWNYKWHRGGKTAGYEEAQEENVTIRFSGLPAKAKAFRVIRSMSSEKYGNPYGAYINKTNQQISPEPLVTDLGSYVQRNGGLNLEILLPPSSVVGLEINPIE